MDLVTILSFVIAILYLLCGLLTSKLFFATRNGGGSSQPPAFIVMVFWFFVAPTVLTED